MQAKFGFRRQKEGSCLQLHPPRMAQYAGTGRDSLAFSLLYNWIV